jgi:hypothetical protein
MLITARELLKYSTHATDGDVGGVDDVLFDDRGWMVRYLVTDVGTWLASRPLLIPVAALGKIDATQHKVAVSLTREEVMQGPGLDADMPVRRQMARKYRNYAAWPVLWFEGFYTPLETLSLEESAGDPHLRSVSEITGYRTRARDGEIGHAVDFLIDNDIWSLRDFVVQMGGRDGKKVLVAPYSVAEVSWPMSTVFVDLPREKVSALPAFDAAALAESQLVRVRQPSRR